jgi:protein-glucosylgalactosylhydroxylysine glucosidase
MVSRRRFLGTLVGTAGGLLLPGELSSNTRSTTSSQRISRAVLVRRHNPRLYKVDPLAPLTVGNGEFAFSADVTGLQTLSGVYENSMPLCTMSQWGWHTVPAPATLKTKGLRLTQYNTHGRPVGYATSAEGQTELYNWLRENPHRLHLCRISLQLKDNAAGEIEAGNISVIEQQLDLWTGVLKSKFKLKGEPVLVTTAVHPRLDLLAVAIESSLVAESKLGVRFEFPYGSASIQAADWNQTDKHCTRLSTRNRNRVMVHRSLDLDSYSVAIEWTGQAKLESESEHRLLLSQPRSARASRLEFVASFAPHASESSLPSVATTLAASNDHWQHFWSEGGAVELSDSTDRRAAELERRIVLSQYLTAIQCSGSLPPQETGLTVNSWYGKFHLEMHWWHATHFALWNRLPLFERSLSWYESILPSAQERARSQGYAGARWPKMVGPEGRDSPSPIGPLLIWQQPHPIVYAELCYQSRPRRETLTRYRQIVFESAAFMASYAFFDRPGGRFVLGPPVIPAQENHPPLETWNPTFELAYWAHGLTIAQCWRERLGLPRNAEWERVITKLARLPVRDGVYLAHENCPQTYTERNRDHPSMLAALGVLPGESVDRETMRRTLQKVIKEWKWDETWGWDYPLTAMTAARLGEPKMAVDALLMTTEKNRYLPNGHNWQRQNLPCYLPGNGGLLYAIAMMAGGWRGAPRGHAPGFPADGSWRVQVENLNSVVLKTI